MAQTYQKKIQKEGEKLSGNQIYGFHEALHSYEYENPHAGVFKARHLIDSAFLHPYMYIIGVPD